MKQKPEGSPKEQQPKESQEKVTTETAQKQNTETEKRQPSFSLKQSLSNIPGELELPKKTTPTTKQEEKGVEPFTAEEVLAALHKYIDSKDLDKRICQTLTAYTPEVTDDFAIYIKVNNSLQDEYIEKMKSGLEHFLQKELANKHVQIKTVNPLAGEISKESMSMTDKWKYMLEKNPTINVLKDTFGLQME